MKTSDLPPGKCFGPGYFIRERMKQKEWTLIRLALKTGLPLRIVNTLILDRAPLTPVIAKSLGIAFGTTAEYWMNLDASYRRYQEYLQSQKKK